MLMRKWIGFFFILLAFAAGQSTYFHSHTNHEEQSSIHFNSASNQTSFVDEDCNICDFIYNQHYYTTHFHSNFSIGIFYTNASIVSIYTFHSKSQNRLANKAPPVSC